MDETPLSAPETSFVPSPSSIPTGIKGFRVQFILACEDPVNNVKMDVKNRMLHFEVPINHPDLHKLDLFKLIRCCRL